MQSINWKTFEIKNLKATEAFESLCYFLFCRKYGLTEGARTDFNQVGLETEPVKNSDGEYCGFQSKFFEKTINYSNISESVNKALEAYSELKHIIIFINQQAQTSCKSAKAMEDACRKKGVTIEWFLPNNFLISLNQPHNLDLAEFYFGEIDVLKNMSASKNIRMNTILQSKEYVELNLVKKDTVLTVVEYSKLLLESPDKLHIFTGVAGSGKSVCMQKLLNIYGGFEEASIEEQYRVVGEIGATCVFINLNNTSVDFLERNVLSNLNNQKYIFLLDGLDEVSSQVITSTLIFIETLLARENTKKVVISSRLSSYNKYILKANFPLVSEFIIDDLSEKQIQKYFDDKKDIDKKNRLVELSETNSQFYKNITDMLSLSLLWSYVFQINSNNFLADLMEISVSTIMNDIHHKKHLEELNIPNPKVNAIVEINIQLAFYLFENEKYAFTQQDLQNIIMKLYDRCDYLATNQIISYLSDAFFDTDITENTQTFSYRHRRFSEYFTLMSIEKIVQNNLTFLRNSNVIINKDLFENMLIPYLQNKAMKTKDIPLALTVGVFNVYLGNDRAWGVDKDFYYWSRWILYSIVALPDDILINAIEDKTTPIYKYVHDIPLKIISALSKDAKHAFNEELRQSYINYILFIALMHKCGKKDFLPMLLSDFNKIETLRKEKNYHFNSISNRDNYLVWHNLLYISTVVGQDDIDSKIENIIEGTTELSADDLFAEYISLNTFYLSSLYYNILLYHTEKCCSLIERMNLNQLSYFCLALSNPECLDMLVRHESIKASLLSILNNQISGQGFGNILCLALKKILGSSLTEEEIAVVSSYLESSQFKSHSIFWREHCDVVGFIGLAFKEYISSEIVDTAVNQYISAYICYFELLCGKYTISKFISCIKGSIRGNSEAVYHVRILLGKALALPSIDKESVRGSVNFLDDLMKDGGLLIIYHTMKLLNSAKFIESISASTISKLNTPSVYQDIDYTSTSDLLFMLSFISSSHDRIGGYELLLKGLSNGMMRMNDRKDSLGDYKLLEGLEVILKNNWLSTDKLIEYMDRILASAYKMDAFHIENDVHGQVMDLLQKYDFDAAQYYYSKISGFIDNYNLLHFHFASDLVNRGKCVDDIENCINNITASFDRYHQKISWDSFYYKISIYLRVATCDFYAISEQNEYFLKACEEIDELEYAGWKRELKEREYEVYAKLCKEKRKEIDVDKEKEIKYEKNIETPKIDVFAILNSVNTKEDLMEFISKLQREYLLDSFEINEMLIKKSVELSGNIEDIIGVLSKSYYPSNTSYSTNSRTFWMTVASALKNTKTKNTMLEYLISHGGGHDSFAEIIKIYGNLGNKDICVNTFEKMLDCIEFLLC